MNVESRSSWVNKDSKKGLVSEGKLQGFTPKFLTPNVEIQAQLVISLGVSEMECIG
jgi:hypothetical protein